MQPPTLTPTRTPTQTQTLTTGLLTAASMKTLRTASRTADGVFIDVIVTAGISNSRAAGADADMLGFDRAADGVSPGTINTIVVTNATLSAAALVEAHALAIESKCAACTELGLVCTKSGRPAQGTGTDATVVVSECGGRRVRYAGKHTLFAELLGQATQEATHAALLACVDYMYGGPVRYTLRNWTLSAASSLQGARPCVPFSPSAPVPNAPASVICVGAAAVALSLVSPLPHSARVLLAAVAWDRCLGEPPLCVHPVMIVGNLISACVRAVPKLVYASPVLGLASGTALLLSLVAGSLASAWLILSAARAGAALATVNVAARLPGSTVAAAAADVATLGVILLEVLLLKSSLALQLLCTVALQMAKLLERRRIPHARDQLSWLCSRDPTDLGIEDLVGGTLESDPRHNLGPPTPPPGAICSPIPAASRSQVQCLLRALSGPSPRTCLTASSLPSSGTWR
jgi:adenosylcobinamide amidohydrolase